jgi:O-antigen/teichoic acid export membrane protein
MLKQKARLAALWSSGDVIIKNGLNFGVTILLTRLLTPVEFGIVALLSLFTGIAGAFVDGGFSSALVQKQDTCITDESTVFWFNLTLGTIAGLILWELGPTIAAFYDLPVLTPLVGLMAINITISALASVQNALLMKRLDFRLLTQINATAMIISSIIAVWLAWVGFGIWALAAQTFSLSIVTTTLLWWFSKWRPKRIFSFAALRKLFGFGGYIFASTLLHNVFANSYTVIIGRFFKVTDVGHYQRATGLSDSISLLLSTVVARVSFPLFSAIANDKERLHRGAQMTLRGTMLLNVPAMLGLFIVADNLVITLYGEAWRFAVPYLKILAIAGLFMPLHSINLNLLLAQGYSRQYFHLEIVKKTVGIVCLLIGAWYAGVIGVAWATLLFNTIGIVINTHFTKKHVGYGLFNQLKDILPIINLAMLMTFIVYWIGLQFATQPQLALMLQIISGVVTYLALIRTFNMTAFTETLSLLCKAKRGK